MNRPHSKTIPDSLTNRLWEKVFRNLRSITPFHIIRTLVPSLKTSRCFKDLWVLGNCILSAICLLLSFKNGIQWWEAVFLLYGGARIFDIVIYQINVLLFNHHTETRTEKDAYEEYRRITIFLFHHYIEMLFWFALFYRNFDFLFHSGSILLNSFRGSLYFSLVTMSGLGYGDIVPAGSNGILFVWLQTIIGVWTLLVFARYTALLPCFEAYARRTTEVVRDKSPSRI